MLILEVPGNKTSQHVNNVKSRPLEGPAKNFQSGIDQRHLLNKVAIHCAVVV